MKCGAVALICSVVESCSAVRRNVLQWCDAEQCVAVKWNAVTWNAVTPSIYRLTADELAVAELIGERRNRLNFGGSNLPNEFTSLEFRQAQHSRAAAAEIAVSRHYNLCWSGCGKGSEGIFDVGNCLQVRSTMDPVRGLIVRPRDVIDQPCVLVEIDSDYKCALIGWEYHRVVRKLGKLCAADTSKPYWMLAREKLQPLDTCPIQFLLDGVY